jgi:hypothetical protein
MKVIFSCQYKWIPAQKWTDKRLSFPPFRRDSSKELAFVSAEFLSSAHFLVHFSIPEVSSTVTLERHSHSQSCMTSRFRLKTRSVSVDQRTKTVDGKIQKVCLPDGAVHIQFIPCISNNFDICVVSQCPPF